MTSSGDAPKAGEHASRAPSASHRWIVCPGSVSRSTFYEDETSFEAAEGTFAHGVRSDCLEFDLDAVDHLGRRGEVEGYAFEVDAEFVHDMQSDLDATRARIAEIEPDDVYVEERVDLVPYGMLDAWGTSDLFALSTTTRTLLVDDLKWGVGVIVEPEENSQLLTYAAGALARVNLYANGRGPDHPQAADNVDDVIIRIAQPRAFHPRGRFREWHTTARDVLEWVGDVLRPAYKRTFEENPPIVPSVEGCFYCPCRHDCAAAREFHLNECGFSDVDDFAVSVEINDFKANDPADVIKMIQAGDKLEHILKSMRAHAHRQLELGDPVYREAFKLVRSVTRRRIRDEDKALAWVRKKRLAGMLTVSKMHSPRQVEIRLAKDHPRYWKEFEELHVVKPEGGLNMVPADDPREDAVGEGIFDEILDEDGLLD